MTINAAHIKIHDHTINSWYLFLPTILVILAVTGYFLYPTISKNLSKNNKKSNTASTQQQQSSQNVICIDDAIDQKVIDAITQAIQSQNSNNAKYTFQTYQHRTPGVNSNEDSKAKGCTTLIQRNPISKAGSKMLWNKIYVIASRFDSSTSNISEFDLEVLIGKQNLNNHNAVWSDSTDNYLKTQFSTGIGYTTSSDPDNLTKLKQDNSYIAIIPFENLNPALKVISIDQQSPLGSDFNIDTYPLNDSYWIKTNDDQIFTSVQSIMNSQLGEKNYDESLLASVILTGSSSLGSRRQYTNAQQNQEYTYPVLGISDLLKSADIAHVSNESSFDSNCTQTATTSFLCGKNESFDMLKVAGVDVVGLTGAHLLDDGINPFKNTLALYDSNQIKYFGSGLNKTNAHKPAILEVKGKKYAFLGYSMFTPTVYLATDKQPGNATLNLAADGYQVLDNDIKNAKSQADFVFVEFQFITLYDGSLMASQKALAAQAQSDGADIVYGTQLDKIQGLALNGNQVIFYGLGNFLFDTQDPNVEQNGLAVENYFYNGKYLGFKIIPVVKDNLLQAVVADTQKADTILQYTFERSTLK